MFFRLLTMDYFAALLLVAGFLFSLPASAVASEECSHSLAAVHAKLEKIRAEIEQVQSRIQYEESQKKHYDTIESLLNKASYCIEHEALDKESVLEWEKIKRAMASLRATAQESAFTDFSEWLKAKQSDLGALKVILGNGPDMEKQETGKAGNK